MDVVELAEVMARKADSPLAHARPIRLRARNHITGPLPVIGFLDFAPGVCFAGGDYHIRTAGAMCSAAGGEGEERMWYGAAGRKLAVLPGALAVCLGAVTDAFAKQIAAPTKAVPELAAKRAATSTISELRDGSHVTRVATGPMRWRDKQGDWRTFDLSLAPVGNARLAGSAGPLQVSLPTKLCCHQVAQLCVPLKRLTQRGFDRAGN